MQQRTHPFMTGLITAVVILFAVTAVAISGIPGGGFNFPWNHTMTVKAQLKSADALAPGAGVDIAGVKVGTVRQVDASNGMALVTMTVDSSQADIRGDASVMLRPHGLFGPQYIEIVPGKDSTHFADGGTITADKSTLPVDLDQVLAALQPTERSNLQTAIIELGKASASRGTDVNHLITAANTLSVDLQAPLTNLAQLSPNLNDMIIKGESFNSYFAQAPLDQLVANSNQTLQALATNSTQLGDLLNQADTLLTQLDGDLGGQTGNLRATIEKLPATIDQLNTLNSTLALFGRNLQGLDTSIPGNTDVTPGIIAAIENPKSAFSAYDCLTNQNPCPANKRNYYLRVQVFNFGAT